VDGGATGTDPIAIDFDRDGAVQHGHRDNDTESALGLDEQSLDSGKQAFLDLNAIAFLKIRSRQAGQAGPNHGLHGFDFVIRNGDELFAERHNINNAWSHKHWQTIVNVKTAKYVTGKERQIEVAHWRGTMLPIGRDKSVKALPS
jgi:hypothetical protein